MNRYSPRNDLPRAQLLAARAFASLDRFLHIEAASGAVLLFAAAVALIWANSPFAASYHALWHTPLSIGVGSFVFSQSVHFWVNDALMTVFFLVVGMEIRREMHEGALRDMQQASLPIMAALGGVAVPALVYLSFNADPVRQHGWAVPTATDIAFAVGMLALLGRSIPSNVRIFLLAVAIIDDIIAVLIIALFYSGGLDYSGFIVAGLGILLVMGFHRLGIGSAYAYLLPGVTVWVGLLMTGAHPTLAGVVLGMMTPVMPLRMGETPLELMSRSVGQLRTEVEGREAHQLALSLRHLRLAQREFLPPVVRMQMLLHPWVAFGVMPIFALANAGVSLEGVELSSEGPLWVMGGIALALAIGKPLGMLGMSWLVIRLGWCRMPPGVCWRAMWLIGLLAGIGFTMSIFIATLAFVDEGMLGAAKLGVLLGSCIAAVAGLSWGVVYRGSLRLA